MERQKEKNKVFNIDIPDGYVIDKDRSDFEKGIIHFKEKHVYPKTWFEFVKLNNANIGKRKASNLYISRNFNISKLNTINNIEYEMLEKHIKFIQLDMLRECYCNDWKPDDNDGNEEKFNIVFNKNGFVVVRTYYNHSLFCFPNEKSAEKFIEHFKNMLEEVKEYFGWGMVLD